VMMLDVADAATGALKLCRQEADRNNTEDEYYFFLSCTAESERPKLEAIFKAGCPDLKDIHYLVDRGHNFDEHFNDHYRQLFEQGYHAVVCIGGDLPTIAPEFIFRAFQWLTYLENNSHNGAMVLAPCQAAGVSLIGLTSGTPMDFSGVFYNSQGVPALDAIISIAAERQIPTAMLETQNDVDTMEDLAHIISIVNTLAYVSPFQPNIYIPKRTIQWIIQYGLYAHTPPNEEHDPRGYIDAY
jgi:uncharacterized protein